VYVLICCPVNHSLTFPMISRSYFWHNHTSMPKFIAVIIPSCRFYLICFSDHIKTLICSCSFYIKLQRLLSRCVYNPSGHSALVWGPQNRQTYYSASFFVSHSAEQLEVAWQNNSLLHQPLLPLRTTESEIIQDPRLFGDQSLALLTVRLLLY